MYYFLIPFELALNVDIIEELPFKTSQYVGYFPCQRCRRVVKIQIIGKGRYNGL